MTNFIFCLIFIQVSIFLIAGILLLATFYFGMKRQPVTARMVSRNRYRSRKPRTSVFMEARADEAAMADGFSG